MVLHQQKRGDRLEGNVRIPQKKNVAFAQGSIRLPFQDPEASIYKAIQDSSLIDSNLLAEEEKNWVNDYQQRVFNELAPRLEAEEVAWLRSKCDEI